MNVGVSVPQCTSTSLFLLYWSSHWCFWIPKQWFNVYSLNIISVEACCSCCVSVPETLQCRSLCLGTMPFPLLWFATFECVFQKDIFHYSFLLPVFYTLNSFVLMQSLTFFWFTYVRFSLPVMTWSWTELPATAICISLILQYYDKFVLSAAIYIARSCI